MIGDFIKHHIGRIVVRGMVFMIACLLIKINLGDTLLLSFGVSFLYELFGFLLSNIFQQFNVTRKKYSIAVAILLLIGITFCSVTFAFLMAKVGGH